MGLIFCDRSELRQALNVSDDLEDKSIIYRAYLKAYTTGIIDNIGYLMDIYCSNTDMSIREIKEMLYEDADNLKLRAWKDFEDII